MGPTWQVPQLTSDRVLQQLLRGSVHFWIIRHQCHCWYRAFTLAPLHRWRRDDAGVTVQRSSGTFDEAIRLFQASVVPAAHTAG
jgi:hypothetical protein